MEKKTLYAFLVLAALSVLAIIVMRSPQPGDRVGERPRPVPEISAGSIATLEIAQPPGKVQVTITRRGEGWQVIAPYDKPADKSAVKAVVEALEKLKWGDITTEKKDRHEELEVSEDKAVRVKAKDSAGKVLADLLIGKAVGGATMVRLAGKDEVWQVSDLPGYSFRKEDKLWRDHTIFDLKADEAEKVYLSGGGTEVTLERLPAPKGADGKEGSTSIYDAKWKVIPGGEKAMKPEAGAAIDDNLINGIVQGIAGLHAADFLDSAKPEEVGLRAGGGQQEVKVTFKGEKSAAIRIGALKGEDYHVQAEGSPQIFTVKKFTLERVAHLPQDIRDKTLTDFKEDQLEAVTVQQGTDVLALKREGSTWKANKVADADESKVKGVAESFVTLTGFGFVAPGAAELSSLAKPAATVTLKPKGAAQVVLKVGATKGEDVIVQRVGKDPVWVKKYNVDRFLKKPADVAKDKK